MHAAPTKRANLLADLVATARGTGDKPAGPVVMVGLVGRGIESSRSPTMHRREGARLGLACDYELIDFDRLAFEDSALGQVIASAEELGFSGLNVTHPFKQSVIPLLSDLSPEAATIGAVNTVLLAGGRRTGYNTDSWGFAESFRADMGHCSLVRVLQFGAGGAGAAVAHALLELGAERIAVFDKILPRAIDLAGALNERFPGKVTALTEIDAAFKQATGVVNTTPVGMVKYPGLPFAPHLLSPHHWVAEVIYFPAETELLKLARQRGCRTLPGLGMAVNQAVRAFELFTGIKPDRAAMTRHFAADGS